ncbi:acyl-CoA dehydrogenase family protein [Candidatus Manganitrophus noduliformans]|uniref:Acyl-CoA dehydrogenase n=1 Tax=Candidatus Manganitrophus noduliformans TaxID=2606439 RepID=A0A7X6DLI7_9BACT|nr:acyl-CoA dehydrogenase family protein [Candidatus Manganitrophus noduliformans]NKE69274.1 acyl-CoA dehydrogenase [Candidatus Manganitrophus noduliformans]
MPFQGVDFLHLDDELKPEERMIRDEVRRWVEAQVLPIIVPHYEAGTFPMTLIPQMAAMGLLGANLDPKYGCAGLNSVAYGLINQELERGDSGLRSFVSVQSGLVMWPIAEYGSEAQKDRWLPKMARGETIGCFGLTEPDFGSNPEGMITRAEKRGAEYILNGTKMWITNGTIADVALIWAKDDQEIIRGFLVEKGTPGFQQNKVTDKFSLRASDTGELVLQDVHIPEANRLPGTDGIKSTLRCLNQARYGIAWGAIGAAAACYDRALTYAKERVQFTRPIAGYQLVQQKLVEMLTEITKMQPLALRLGRLKDQGRLSHVQISMGKRNNVFHALRIARVARDILGANGIMYEHQIARHLCNLESVYTYEGTHDIHTLILGEHITGLSAFT